MWHVDPWYVFQLWSIVMQPSTFTFPSLNPLHVVGVLPPGTICGNSKNKTRFQWKWKGPGLLFLLTASVL